MRTLILTALSSALVLGLSACGDADEAADTTVVETEATPMAGATTASTWPEGARIVEEGGKTYRVDTSGTRVELGPNDARIVTEGGTRYRVDPDGQRYEIDTQGAVRIGDSVITGNAPNGASDVETPGEAVTDAAEDAAEAVGDVVTGKAN